jgi:hypothetical protein
MQSNLATFLEAIEKKLPETKPPARENDILYQSSYVHQHHDSAICECGDGNRICEAALHMSCEELGCGNGPFWYYGLREHGDEI